MEARAAAATIAGGVPNIAALRLRPGTDAEPYAVVLGYYQPDDGGGGLFYWSANATEPDNGGTIIAPTGTDVGRRKRVMGQPGIVDLAWFGATVGDGAGLANRLALTGALQLLAARGGGTLLVSKFYPLGDASDPSWLGIPPQQPWAIHVSIATTETRDVSISGNHVSGYAAGIGGGTNAGVTCSSISITGNTVTRLTGSPTLGMRVDPSTPGVSLVGNRVDPGGSYDYVLFSSCRMAGNSGKVTLFNDSTFFEESQGHHTFAPSVSPPASPPAGVSFETGDVVYHAAPRSGSNVGWVWTGSGWLPFGAIG
jgi:hypothetical protein